MADESKIEFPSPAWLKMREEVIVTAVRRARFPDGFRYSLVQRYRDGARYPNGMMQGFRLEIMGATVTFQEGVTPEDTGDANLDTTMDALRQLIHLSNEDPALPATMARLIDSGEFVKTGNWDPLANISPEVHEELFRRTA